MQVNTTSLLVLAAGAAYVAWSNRATLLPKIKEQLGGLLGGTAVDSDATYRNTLLSLRPIVAARADPAEIAALNTLLTSGLTIVAGPEAPDKGVA